MYYKVSNLILASQLPADERQKRFPYLTEDDLITEDEVGVYLFDPKDGGKGGTYITSVPIDSEFGISEEEFIRVSEAIGDETYKLTLAVSNGVDNLE